MTEKYTKDRVVYSKGMKLAHCGICAHFRKPKSCTLVEGTIDPSMWCKLWAKREKAK